jgi:DNA-binding NarL/FixJ family response regulator
MDDMVGTAAATRARVHADLIRLVHRRVDMDQLARDVRRTLVKAVPFDGACLSAFDPATLLPTRCAVDNRLSPAATLRLYELEARQPDFDTDTGIATVGRPVPGDPDRCIRQHTSRRPSWSGDQLRAALTSTTGTWGALTLLRAAERPHFTEADVRFVASLAAPLADGLRRTTLVGNAIGEAPPDAGLVVLGSDDAVETSNEAGAQWLDELEESDRPAELLPTVVRAVAARTRRTAGGSDTTLARARVRTRGGRWAVVHGSLLGDGADAPVAVMLELARPPDLAPLIADVYGLTEQERRVTELVARGCTTSEIASRLHLSAYTVQDHLKAIFDRIDVRSRGELVARLFFDHSAPTLTAPARACDRADAPMR